MYMYTVNPTEQHASFKAVVLVWEFHSLNPCSDKKKILDLNSVPVSTEQGGNLIPWKTKLKEILFQQ